VKQNIALTARKLVEQKVTDAGFCIWDVRYEKDAGVWTLVFELDKAAESGTDENMSMSDCERANAIIEPIIDEADPIEESYTLEVSSAGLTRSLRTDYHFETAVKKKWPVMLKLFTPVGDAKELSGVITSSDGTEIEINQIKIERKNIAKAAVVLG
jgi:ribosome maturation factor RimP